MNNFSPAGRLKIAALTSVALVATVCSAAALAAPQPSRAALLSDAREKIGEAFGVLDADRDGQMTRVELLAFTGPRNIENHHLQDRANWKKADHNRNGTISRNEFIHAALADFARDIDAR